MPLPLPVDADQLAGLVDAFGTPLQLYSAEVITDQGEHAYPMRASDSLARLGGQ